MDSLARKRLEDARALLRREGLEAGVSMAGLGSEILVVRASPEQRPEVARLAPAARALGFRYVTIELDD